MQTPKHIGSIDLKSLVEKVTSSHGTIHEGIRHRALDSAERRQVAQDELHAKNQLKSSGLKRG